MRFFALGIPVPQGSKRGFATKTGKVVLVESGGSRHKSWRESVSYAAYEASRQQLDGPLQGPLAARIEFLMPRPKSKPKAVYVDVKPDIDKCVRAVFDSLSHVVFRDDAQVVDLRTTKRYVGVDEVPGAWIEVFPADDL